MVGRNIRILSPLFSLVGLPGETAIIFITSTLVRLVRAHRINYFDVVGIKRATILAIMCLVSHNLIVESSIQAKTILLLGNDHPAFIDELSDCLYLKSGASGMERTNSRKALAATQDTSLKEVFILWITGSMSVIITILLIVILMILHNVLDEFRLMKKTVRFLFALWSDFFGLPLRCCILVAG